MGGVLLALTVLLYRASLPPKKVHFSFDDVVIGSTGSIDDDFLSSLSFYNKLYGAKFSLYTFDVLDCVQHTVKQTDYTWLKYSYHGSPEPFDSLAASRHYVSTLTKQLEGLRHVYGDSALSRTVRLHYFYADSAMLREANRNKIRTFLAADTPGRTSYSLDSCLSDLLFRVGELHLGKLRFYRTDLRLENTSLAGCLGNGNLSDSTLVIFTHQIMFGRRAKLKMHILMWFLWLNNYEFVTEL